MSSNPAQVLWRAKGLVEAPVGEVVEQLFLPYEKNGPRHNEIIEVDRASRTVAVSGHWWYRGVTRIDPHERGSLVTFELQNIAQTAKWAVAGILLQARLNGTLEETRTGGLPKRLAELGEHFGCRTELLESARP